MALDNGVELHWLGHATWLLTTGEGTRVLIDPWLTGNPTAIPITSATSRPPHPTAPPTP